MRVVMVILVATNVFFGAPATHAATDEEKCLTGLLKAKGKFEKCINAQLAKAVVTGPSTQTEENLAKCRLKYDAAWTKLSTKLLGTSCNQPARFDSNLFTVTDNLTGLTWAMNNNNGSGHDVDNTRTWSLGPPYEGDGTAYTTYLRDFLNAGPGYSGNNDWRLPTFAELQTILLPTCTTSPCVPAVFNSGCIPACASCSCTNTSLPYWSASTEVGDSSTAWSVLFSNGAVLPATKTLTYTARGVRGGY